MLSELCLGALAVAFGWLVNCSPVATLDWSVPDLFRGIAAAVTPLVLLLWTMRSRLDWLAGHRRLLDGLLGTVFHGWSPSQFALISAAAGFCEEMLFRGLLQGGLAKLIGPFAALGVAGLLFGVAHFITPVYALLATLIGLYLGAIWLWTGNLLVPVVAHGLYDFVALLWLMSQHQRGRLASPPG